MLGHGPQRRQPRAPATISDDGTRVEFDSDADNLTASPDYYGVYLRDLTSGRTLLASADTFYSVEGALSGDGSFVGWFSGHGVTPDADPDLGGVFGRPYARPGDGDDRARLAAAGRRGVPLAGD